MMGIKTAFETGSKFVSAVKLCILTWTSVEMDSLFAPAPSGHLLK